MATAKVSDTDDGQILHLPKEYRFEGPEVEIYRRGDEVILRERRRDMSRAFELLSELPDDFLASGRQDAPAQARDDR